MERITYPALLTVTALLLLMIGLWTGARLEAEPAAMHIPNCFEDEAVVYFPVTDESWCVPYDDFFGLGGLDHIAN